MRKSLLILILISVTVSGYLHGQSPDDISSVLQKCIELEELTPLYPLENNGSYKQLVVMQHGVSFPAGINVSLSGKPILFKSKQDVLNGTNAYFLFWDFSLTANTARIVFLFYDNPGNDEPTVSLNLDLEKSGNEWLVINSKIERR